jgi:hypothetical protein
MAIYDPLLTGPGIPIGPGNIPIPGIPIPMPIPGIPIGPGGGNPRRKLDDVSNSERAADAIRLTM